MPRRQGINQELDKTLQIKFIGSAQVTTDCEDPKF